MTLSREARQILKLLADERDRDPPTRLQGLDQRTVGRRIGAYRGNVMYPVAELTSEGLAAKSGDRLLITEKGYRLARGWRAKASGPLRGLHVATVEGIARALRRP